MLQRAMCQSRTLMQDSLHSKAGPGVTAAFCSLRDCCQQHRHITPCVAASLGTPHMTVSNVGCSVPPHALFVGLLCAEQHSCVKPPLVHPTRFWPAPTC